MVNWFTRGGYNANNLEIILRFSDTMTPIRMKSIKLWQIITMFSTRQSLLTINLHWPLPYNFFLARYLFTKARSGRETAYCLSSIRSSMWESSLWFSEITMMRARYFCRPANRASKLFTSIILRYHFCAIILHIIYY